METVVKLTKAEVHKKTSSYASSYVLLTKVIPVLSKISLFKMSQFYDPFYEKNSVEIQEGKNCMPETLKIILNCLIIIIINFEDEKH